MMNIFSPLILIFYFPTENCLDTRLSGRPHSPVDPVPLLDNCSWSEDCNISAQSDQLESGDCDSDSGQCRCPAEFPVLVAKSCVKGVFLDQNCVFSEQCKHNDPNSVCAETSPDKSTCVCSEGFFQQQSSESGVSCSVSLASETYTDDLATLAGLGIGLSVLTIFICFTLKLFSKARNTETRGYGDASIPPTIMVEGKDVSTADVETCSRTSSKSRIYTPGPPLTPSQVRRMSELSTLSVTVGERDFKMRPVSPNTSGPGSLDMLFEEGKDENVEQQLTIIPKVGSFSRRKSLVNHAFPELHRKSSAASNSLLILTRTKTDAQGRRHSVAVPLLQAPPAAADSGFVIERKARGAGAENSGRGGRRHSLQVGGLRHHGSLPGSRSPRRSGSVRRQSRRPSKQGFYQFLEQAVAF